MKIVDGEYAADSCCDATKNGDPGRGLPRALSQVQGLGQPAWKEPLGASHRNLREARGLQPGSQRARGCFRIPIQIMGLPDLTATVPKLQQNCFGKRLCKPFSLRRKSALG
jgi:hypothetical protein